MAEKAPRPDGGMENFTVTVNRYRFGCGPYPSVQDGTDEYVDKGVIFLPESYTPDGKASRLVISCHGSGSVVDENYTQTARTWNDFLIRMGYAVMDVNGGTPSSRHFGNPVAVQAYIKGWQYAVDKYNLYREVFVLGCSMGGLAAFTLAGCGAVPVKALAGFCPVVDLFRQAWCFPWYSGEDENDYGCQRREIAELYGFEGRKPEWSASREASPSECEYFLNNLDKTAGFNPMTAGIVNAAGLYTDESGAGYKALIKHFPVPVKIWQSDTDDSVNAEYGKHIIAAIRRGGGIAFHRSYKSGEHTPGWGETVEVTSPDGKTVRGFSNEYECYLWFHRWE